MRSIGLISGLVLLAAPAGQLHAQAHVHGQAEAALTLATDGALHVELTAPAADILGFERAPETEEERAIIAAAHQRLSQPLVALSAQAGCTLAHTGFSGPDAEPDHGHDHGHTGAHDHPAHDHFSDDGADSAGAHGDIVVEWRFDCAAPAALVQADFAAVFETFTSIVRVEATALVGERPAFGVLTRQRSWLDLR